MIKNGISRFHLVLSYITTFLSCSVNHPKEVWIGDSHSFYIKNPRGGIKRYSITEDKSLVLWLGPKLLYTISKEGIKLSFADRVLLKLTCRGSSLFLVFGEIDIRVHLPLRNIEMSEYASIVRDFKSQTTKWANFFEFKRIVVIGPVPPSDMGPINPNFPRNGSLIVRIQCHSSLIKELLKLSNGFFNVFDSRGILSNKEGSLSLDLTDDGVHLNSKGSRILLSQLDNFLGEISDQQSR